MTPKKVKININSYWFDLEVQGDQRENQALNKTKVSTSTLVWMVQKKTPLLDLGQDNRKHGGLQGPRCPECRQEIQFWQSLYKTIELMSITSLVGGKTTSNAIWSLPILISSSCFPTISFEGQFESSSLRNKKSNVRMCEQSFETVILGDFTSLYNTFEFFYDERANPHC